MTDVERLEVPVEAGLELGTIIGLDHKYAKGQPPNDLVHEADRRSLVAGILDLEYADARAIIDGGELIEALLGAWDSLEELDIQLQAMSCVFR